MEPKSQSVVDAEAMAYTQLVVAWWSTRQHKRRVPLAKLRRHSPRITAAMMSSSMFDKGPTGYRLTSPPDDCTALLYTEGMIT